MFSRVSSKKTWPRIMNQDLIQDRMMSNPYPSPDSNTFTMPQLCPRPVPSPGSKVTLCIKLQPNPIFKPHPAVQQLPQVLSKALAPVKSSSPSRKSSPHIKIQPLTGLVLPLPLHQVPF